MKKTIEKLSESIRNKYVDSRTKALLCQNQILMLCFYDLGKKISESSSETEHNSNFYEVLSNELIEKLGKNPTFSQSNLKDLETFYLLYQNYYSQFPFEYEKAMNEGFITESFYHIISLPWSFHKHIIQKCKNVHEAFFYVDEAYYGKWSEKELIKHLADSCLG